MRSNQLDPSAGEASLVKVHRGIIFTVPGAIGTPAYVNVAKTRRFAGGLAGVAIWCRLGQQLSFEL